MEKAEKRRKLRREMGWEYLTNLFLNIMISIISYSLVDMIADFESVGPGSIPGRRKF